jgi:hypothetical protein
MKPSPARHCDWRSALRSVDDADIISLAEALARGMKPIKAVCMAQYTISLKSTHKPNRTKAELYEMLAQAVRNTAQPEPKPKRPPKAKRDAVKAA